MGTGLCRIFVVVAAAVWSLYPPPALAQWRAVRLHDPNSFVGASRVTAITPELQYGWADFSTDTQGLVWSGGSSTWSSYGDRTAISGAVAGQQVGGAAAAGGACLWSDTPSSLVSLHPFNAWGSNAQATDGQQQGGYYIRNPGDLTRAVMWRGTAASAVDLQPQGAISSVVNAVAAGQQGGAVRYSFETGDLAALWSGSAQSMVNLNPDGAIESQITGMVPGQQVGWAFTGGNYKAGMWSGSSGSFVNLNAPGSEWSRALATTGTAQAGYAGVTGLGVTAGVWFGTAQSFVPLAAYLPAGMYYQSIATCIAEDNGVIYVGGYANNVVTRNEEAFVWVHVPAPGAATALVGTAGLLAFRRRRA